MPLQVPATLGRGRQEKKATIPFKITVHQPVRQRYGTPQAPPTTHATPPTTHATGVGITSPSLPHHLPFKTLPNSFGVYRCYQTEPSISHSNAAPFPKPHVPDSTKTPTLAEALGPVPTVTSLLVQHMYSTTSQDGEFTLGSQAKIDNLVLHPDYLLEDHRAWVRNGRRLKLCQEMLNLNTPAYPGSG